MSFIQNEGGEPVHAQQVQPRVEASTQVCRGGRAAGVHRLRGHAAPRLPASGSQLAHPLVDQVPHNLMYDPELRIGRLSRLFMSCTRLHNIWPSRRSAYQISGRIFC